MCTYRTQRIKFLGGLRLSVEHVQAVHNMKEIPEELVEKVRAAIRDE